MTDSLWQCSTCWVAVFDILGFKRWADTESASISAMISQDSVEVALGHLKVHCAELSSGPLDYLWFSDTFVMYSRDDSASSYSVIQQAAKHFMEGCLYSSIPLRGALSCGSLIRSADNRVLMGKAFVDAHLYGEDQDWIGFVLTPAAIGKVRSYGLEPKHHDFVASEAIPMRRYKTSNVLAYRFQNGAANFASPFLPVLEGLKNVAGEENEAKYDRTIAFIQKHYRIYGRLDLS